AGSKQNFGKLLPQTATPKANMDSTAIKADILALLRQDISTTITQEIKNALADNFASLKRDLQDVKNKINNNTAAIRAELDQVKSDVKSVSDGLSAWNDEMVAMQGTVTSLKKEVHELKNKCEDLEGRMRRGNIRIIGVAETQGSSTPEAVSSLLKEVLRLGREVRVDRSHRSLTQRRPAKLNSEEDAADILRRARRGKLHYKGKPIAIFPKYTASVAKARATFTEVRKMLHNKPGICYGILYPARFCVSHNNTEKEFVDAADAMSYVKENILQSREEGDMLLPQLLNFLRVIKQIKQ
uniref:L1 transposable element RRM domain-containing protein n=1 Tax=Oryzias melastigma TaxID=30732 RepID=A0A3B3B532_ORYME